MKKPATKSSKPSIEREQIIVLQDGAGNYYELPRETLERSRVDEDRKEEVAELLEDEDCFTTWIKRATIPGSTAAAPFKGGRALHYAGFYISSTEPEC